VRKDVKQMAESDTSVRLTKVLQALDITSSNWYRSPGAAPASTSPDGRKRRGPAPTPVPPEVVGWVTTMATTNPWYGYKRIAVMCRRAGQKVTNRQCYRVMQQHQLLQTRKPYKAAIHQTAKLWELLPKRPNDLWQMDVTYIHIPGYGWWYAITVIDYFSRYLLAAYLTDSYSAMAATQALTQATCEAERVHGPLKRIPFLVTDNGSSFIARRFHNFVRKRFSHVRIAYRTPTQLGLLERFHRTFKEEEVYWQLYDSPAHARDCIATFHKRYNQVRPHWALIPEEGGDPVTPQNVYEHGVATQIPKWQSWAKAAKERLDRMMNEAA